MLVAEKKSSLLESIYITAPVYLQSLQVTMLNSALPLTAKEQSCIQHIVSIYAELANGFAGCITMKSNQSNAHTLFYGLQSLIKVYLHIAEVYQHPYPNFWKQSYKFYGLACKLELHDLKIKTHNLHSSTINKAFKHLLALYHCVVWSNFARVTC